MTAKPPLHRLPFVHGYADQLAGKGFLDNPYIQDSNNFRVWIDGYVKSIIDHRPLLRRNLFAGHVTRTPQPVEGCPCFLCAGHFARQRLGPTAHWHFGQWILKEGCCPDAPFCMDTPLPGEPRSE